MSGKRVSRLMRQKGLDARPKRPYVHTTNSNHQRGYCPNLLKRNFVTRAPNQVWVGDITYISTDQGFVYLATLVDLFSRRIVGWAIDDCLHDKLPNTASNKA